MPLRQIPLPVIQCAQACQRATRWPASVTIAQWAIESAWGASHMGDLNNYFGVKARLGEPSGTRMTREVLNGKSVMVPQQFRKFSSMEESFVEHGKLIHRSPYRRAAAKLPPLGVSPSIAQVDAFVDELQPVYDKKGNVILPGYATDPNYAKAIKAFMRQPGRNLYGYNLLN